MNNKVIYTAIFGEYDNIEIPKIITPGWDYICFTDDDIIKPPWRFIKIDPYPMSHAKASKMIKILWYQFVGEYNLSIWIDGSLGIACDLDLFVEKYHRGDFTLMNHPARNCIYKEGDIIIKEKIADSQIVEIQLDRYREEGFPSEYGLTANGVMIRSREQSRATFDLWWEEVKNYSHRDQLSFMYAHWKEPIPLTKISYNVINNEFQFKVHGK